MDKHPDDLLQRFIDLDRAARAKRPDVWDYRAGQSIGHALADVAVATWLRQPVGSSGLSGIVAQEIDRRAEEITEALAVLAGELEAKVLERLAPHLSVAVGPMLRGTNGFPAMGIHGAHPFVAALAQLYEYLCGDESGAWTWAGPRPWAP